MIKYLTLIITLILSSCNPFPKEDAHPKVPYLSQLINHKNVLEKVDFNINDAEFEFLKSDKILIKINGDLSKIKIFNIDKTLILELKYDYRLPLYLDKKGNIFVNNTKYFQPDYKRLEKCEIIDINNIILNYQTALEKTIPKNDSIFESKSKIYADNFIKKNNLKIVDSTSAYGNPLYSHYPKIIQDSILKFDKKLILKYPKQDSILNKKVDDYEKILAKRFDIDDLDRTKIGKHIEEENNQLVFWSDVQYVNDFEKEKVKFENFDDEILIEYANGKFYLPIYLYYYQLNKKQRFKVKDDAWVCKVEIEDKTYLYTNSYGLYLVE